MKPLISILLPGIMTFSLSAQPLNDDPCGALPLTVGTECVVNNMDNFEASNTWGVPSTPCASSSKDVWFSAVIPASGMLTIETFAGSVTDAVIAVYTGTCDDLSFTYCNDNYGLDPMPRLDLKGFIPGDTIYIRFQSKGGGPGTFGICVWNNSPPLEKNNDCFSAQLLCTNADFYALSGGPGSYNDLNAANNGCLETGENASSWYVFTIGHPGELSFTITPIGINDNYDFAIWGTSPVCPPSGDPIRCSYANSTGATGIKLGSTDHSEDTEGDGWVKFLDVDVGQTFVLMIDDRSGTGKGFHMEFFGPPTISCTPFSLPVTLTAFTGYVSGSVNILEWTAASQMANTAFLIERSADGLEFLEIGRVEGAGSTSQSIDYIYTDELPPAGTAYYRLAMVAADGERSYTSVIVVTRETGSVIRIYPNPAFGIIKVSQQATPDHLYTIQVVHLSGDVILEQTHLAQTDLLQTELQILTPGIYQILITDGITHNSARVVVF